MRIATWNVNSVSARLPRLLEWLKDTAPDAVCLQETKIADFPVEEVGALGYEVAAHGDGRWNGVAILSRVGLADVRRGLADEPGYPDPEARALGATCGDVRLWSVYVPNGREPGHDHYAYKLAWLAALRTHDRGRADRRAARGDGRLQRRADRRRRLGPGRVRGLDPRDAAGAGRRWPRCATSG